MKRICGLSLIFLGLCFPALAGAQTGATLQVRTDMDCYWKLDGRPMGLLYSDDAMVVPVSPGEHLIEAKTNDGVATMRTKIKVDKGQKRVNIQLRSDSDQQPEARHSDTASEPADTSQTWTDPATRLMWTRKDNGADVNWNQAADYCSSLQLAGYSGWRLPTIGELQGIYDPSVSFQKTFDNGVTYNVHVKGKLELTGWHWSSSQGDAPGKPWQTAWHFNFGKEMPRNSFPLGFNYSMRALCVRPSGEAAAEPASFELMEQK